MLSSLSILRASLLALASAGLALPACPAAAAPSHCGVADDGPREVVADGLAALAALAPGDDEVEVDLRLEVGDALVALARPAEALEHLTRALELARGLEPGRLAASLYALAACRRSLGDFELAHEAAAELVALAEERQVDDVELARSYSTLGVVLVDLGRLDEALAAYGHALEHSSERDDPLGAAALRNNVGAVAVRLRAPDQALAHFERGSELLAGRPASRLAGSLAANRGAVLAQQGEPAAARAAFEEALAVSRALDEPAGQASALANLGALDLQEGLLEEAIPRLERARDLHLAAGNAGGAARAILNLGNAFLTLDLGADAVEAGARGLDLAERAGIRPLQAAAHGLLRAANELEGELGAALEHGARERELERELFDAHYAGSLAALESRLAHREAQRELALLEARSNLDKEHLEHRLALASASLDRETLLRHVAVLGGLTLLVLALVVGGLYVQKRRAHAALALAAAEIRQLEGLLPICAHCKDIRDEDGDWHPLETYMSDRTPASFSHGICPRCMSTEFAIGDGHAQVSAEGESQDRPGERS